LPTTHFSLRYTFRKQPSHRRHTRPVPKESSHI
jgi:hypothetical protein